LAKILLISCAHFAICREILWGLREIMGLQPDIVVDRLLADRSKLLAFIWSIVRDFHATEDIFQEVVVAAMSHAGDIQNTEHLLSWARQAARFKGIDWVRSQKRQPFLLDGDVLDLLEGQWSRLDSVSPLVWTDAVRDCVRKLTDYARQLITLRYVEGLAGREVARRLGRTPRAVYVALGRTYRQLQDCIQGRLAGAPDENS
jgi:RNA polymerase sigma-70 factor, ECF subfamily